MSDGARTRDIPDHNRVLYQLSYAHHVGALKPRELEVTLGVGVYLLSLSTCNRNSYPKSHAEYALRLRQFILHIVVVARR